MKTFPKEGEIIECENVDCGKELLRVLRDIHAGDYLSADDFAGIPPVANPIKGQSCKCFYCGTPFIRSLRGLS